MAEVDVRQMLIASSIMGSDDVLVAISNTGTTREIVQATRLCRELGRSPDQPDNLGKVTMTR